MSRHVGVAFIVTCVAFGIVLLVYDGLGRVEKGNAASPVRRSGCEYEVWTDEKTGCRFLVATRKSNIGGVGVFLIPERDEESDCPDPALAGSAILESTVGWKEIQ